jgi:hypothetical protein
VNQAPVRSNPVPPQALERIDDGEIFSINPDGTYSMDSSTMLPKYTYSLDYLLRTKAFRIVV